MPARRPHCSLVCRLNPQETRVYLNIMKRAVLAVQGAGPGPDQIHRPAAGALRADWHCPLCQRQTISPQFADAVTATGSSSRPHCAASFRFTMSSDAREMLVPDYTHRTQCAPHSTATSCRRASLGKGSRLRVSSYSWTRAHWLSWRTVGLIPRLGRAL